MRKFLFLIIIVLFNLFFSFAQDNNFCNFTNYSKQELYKNIKKAPVSSEDLWRYVWYGGKEINLPIKIFGDCFSFYSDGKLLCEKIYPLLRSNSSIEEYKKVLLNIKNQIDKDSKLYSILSKINFDISGQDFMKKNANALIELQNYFDSKAFYVKKQGSAWYVYNIPYKFLVPFNVTFNWSIQNLSSYYTDIGFVWIILWFLVVLAFVYSIFSKNRILAGITLSSILWYIIWWFVWYSILWYGIWLVAWTMFSVSLFFYYLYKQSSSKYPVLFLIVFVYLILIYQFWLNFIRISSQWGAWPFAWYKQSNWWYDLKIYDDKVNNILVQKGLIQDLDKLTAWQQIWLIFSILQNEKLYLSKISKNEIDPQMAQYVKNILRNKSKIKSLFIKFPYTAKDVFDMQFNHYNKFIRVANSRKEDEGVFIWWTYMRYFINNQKNVYYDHMLVKLWEWLSDGDMCKSYLRIRKDNKIKYIVIDPNIWTVVRFDNASNKTLFDRFFGNINLKTWKLEEKWVLTYLYDMIKAWYGQLFYTNNIAMKYAIISSDDEIRSYLNARWYTGITQNDILNFRYALLAPRYPWSINLISSITKSNNFNFNSQILLSYVVYKFQNRIVNFEVVDDIADIKGEDIDTQVVKSALQKLILAIKDKNITKKMVDAIVSDLDLKQRKLFNEVLQFYVGNGKLEEKIRPYLDYSIWWQSQLFIVEFKN